MHILIERGKVVGMYGMVGFSEIGKQIKENLREEKLIL